jgi:chemotaxis regulatin CheY-phosphate phosphatase CheZ
LLTPLCYTRGHGETVDLQLVLKRVDAVLAGQDDMRAELKSLREKVDGQASTLVGIRRELRELANDVGVLLAAVDDHSRRLTALETGDTPRAHV